MHTKKDLVMRGWSDYELLDSGDNRKLERYGKYVVSRPDTQSIWKPLHPELWEKADAHFEWEKGGSRWHEKNALPESWLLSWHEARFNIKLTSFKHTGIFPEQACNWEWIQHTVKKLSKPKVLNLFGYTGVASIVAAQAGADVTHVDASKQSLTWANENAKLSGVDTGIRYILDDALKFAKREVRRGNKYDGIMLDPPAFGRGPKGETWKIEEQLPDLIDTARELLSDTPGSFLLLNGYAAGYTAQSFMQLVESTFGTINAEYGELQIAENGSERIMSAGIYARFVR